MHLEIFDLILSLHINSPYCTCTHSPFPPLQLCNALLCKVCRTLWAWSMMFHVAAVNTNAHQKNSFHIYIYRTNDDVHVCFLWKHTCLWNKTAGIQQRLFPHGSASACPQVAIFTPRMGGWRLTLCCKQDWPWDRQCAPQNTQTEGTTLTGFNRWVCRRFLCFCRC